MLVTIITLTMYIMALTLSVLILGTGLVIIVGFFYNLARFCLTRRDE